MLVRVKIEKLFLVIKVKGIYLFIVMILFNDSERYEWDEYVFVCFS